MSNLKSVWERKSRAQYQRTKPDQAKGLIFIAQTVSELNALAMDLGLNTQDRRTPIEHARHALIQDCVALLRMLIKEWEHVHPDLRLYRIVLMARHVGVSRPGGESSQLMTDTQPEQLMEWARIILNRLRAYLHPHSAI